MQTRFIKEVVGIIVGKPAEDIVDLLVGKKNVNEFIIAKKLDLTINQTRNILYKLSDYGLVSSIRKKDKKKGWYTYFWKIEVLKTLEFLKGELKKKINQLDYQVKSRETKLFYVCTRCNIEFNEENALLYDFTCNECGDVFTIKDNAKMLKELKKALNRFERELEEVEKEIQDEKDKEEKKKMKVLKKLEKEKEEEKKKRAAERAKLRAKNKKPTKKKVVKKKKKKIVRKKKIVKKKIIKKPKKKVVKRKK
jgi:transcription initiation factor TFIIE subunit alpha